MKMNDEKGCREAKALSQRLAELNNAALENDCNPEWLIRAMYEMQSYLESCEKDALTPSFESYISILEDVYRAVGSDDYQDGCEAYSRFLKEISAFSSQNNSFVRSADNETPRVEAILFHNRESIVSVIQTIGEYFNECRAAGTAPAYTDMLEYLEDRAAEDLENKAIDDFYKKD
jgi:hypothetical protein